MKKTIILVLTAFLVVAFAVSLVSAAATTPVVQNPPFAGCQAPLTDAQKQELAPLYNQMNDLRKQMFEVRKQVIQKQVTFGNMTQEQADERIEWMKQRQENGCGQGMMGRGPGMMRGGPGGGPRSQQQPAN